MSALMSINLNGEYHYIASLYASLCLLQQISIPFPASDSVPPVAPKVGQLRGISAHCSAASVLSGANGQPRRPGAAAKLLDAWERKMFTPIACEALIAELRDDVGRPFPPCEASRQCG